MKDQRLEILGIPQDVKMSGGIIHFEEVPLETLFKLHEIEALGMNQAQNDAPTTGQFLQILKTFETIGIKATVHGYVVSQARADSRVSIEGALIERNGAGDKAWLAATMFFTKKFRHADEFEVDEEKLYCWFD